MNGRVVIVVTLILGLGFIGFFLELEKAGGAAKLNLVATKVKRAPTELDDPIWQKAKAIQVPLEGKAKFAEKKLIVTTKALYTYEDIYFLFAWKDATRSVTKAAWQFDGRKWSHLEGNEDRLALLFEITRIKNFGSQGCTATCHGPYRHPLRDYKFSTGTAAEKGDLWHWKAARTDPYNHADDQWLTVPNEQTGRRDDGGKGGDVRNETEDKAKPLYMQDATRKPSKPGFLLRNEAVRITDYSGFKAGDIIPYRLPQNLIGSRGDIKALSRHAEGGWTLMLYRSLDTDREDDVIFDSRKTYSFAMAVFDDSGDEDSYDIETTITLKFKR
ncbi:MAG: hypothetical protein IMF02_09245 [Proteobacteria bacterium]|nr:hypothetical protein [Pseudomonadota bacterium]